MASPSPVQLPRDISSSWKRLALRSVFFGAGFAVMLCLIAAFAWWYQSHPRAWNQSAITARFDSLEVATNPSGPSYEAEFLYVLENNTSSNYTLRPSDLVVMGKQPGEVLSKEFGHYQASDVTITGPSFIPSRGKAKITVRVSYQYPDDFTTAEKANGERLTQTFNRRLKEINGLVIFDEAKHYRIDLPEGWSNSPGVKGK